MELTRGPHVEPLRREDCPDLEPTWKRLEELIGFVPNTELTMARTPRSLRILVEAVAIFFETATLPSELLAMIGLLSSSTAGCDYSVSQNVARAKNFNAKMQKIGAVWDYETSSLFNEAERCALSFAVKASQFPNNVQKNDVDTLLKYYSETEVTEIAAMVSIHGIFNRFNTAVATKLEPTPLELSESFLPSDKWRPGVHAP